MAQARYAFGDDYVIEGGTRYDCPVLEATGDVPDGVDLKLAEDYDERVREHTGESHGTVSAETAAELWDEVVENWRAATENPPEAHTQEMVDAAGVRFERAKQIREKAF